MDFKPWLETSFDDFFNHKIKIVKRDPPQVKSITLDLYDLRRKTPPSLDA